MTHVTHQDMLTPLSYDPWPTDHCQFCFGALVQCYIGAAVSTRAAVWPNGNSVGHVNEVTLPSSPVSTEISDRSQTYRLGMLPATQANLASYHRRFEQLSTNQGKNFAHRHIQS